MDWFKLYTEARKDPKLCALTPQQHLVWFNLICFAAEQEERGVVPPRKPLVLALECARGNLEWLADTVGILIEFDILEALPDGGYSFVHWADRQRRKPSDEPEATAERKRNQRERDKQTKNNVTPLNKEESTSHAVSRAVTPLDREIDKEKEEESNLQVTASAGANEKKPKPLREVITEQAETNERVSDSLYAAACGVLNKKELTGDQYKLIRHFYDQYGTDSRLDSPLVEYARGECAGRGAGNIKYLLKIMGDRLDDPEWTDIATEKAMLKQTKVTGAHNGQSRRQGLRGGNKPTNRGNEGDALAGFDYLNTA